MQGPPMQEHLQAAGGEAVPLQQLATSLPWLHHQFSSEQPAKPFLSIYFYLSGQWTGFDL
jgi:hypothetical protein